jgi:choline dehydrogenase
VACAAIKRVAARGIKGEMTANSDRYDAIIVGAGASGCALAARLSEDRARRVLLLEAGPRFVGIEAYPPELRYSALFGASMPGHPNNWSFVATLRPQVRQPLSRGRVVGGSTAINGSVFTRGIAEDFDTWVAAGNDLWSYDAVLPYYCKSENDADLKAPYHSQQGPVPVRRIPVESWSPVSSAFAAACEAANFARDADMNAPGSIGVGALPLNSVDGVRFNSALAYLDPVAARPNLQVMPQTNALKVLLHGGRATGVLVEREGRTTEILADEIVLSAGSVKSPQLLMVSGIGPADELRAAGIPILHESPHVGRNFTDHCTVQLPVKIPGHPRLRVDPLKSVLAQVGLHYTAAGSTETSDMMLMQTVVPTNAAVLQQASLAQRLRAVGAMRHFSRGKLKEQLFSHWDLTITIILMQGRSRGQIHLASADAREAPGLHYHYLEDPEDLRRLRDGMRLSARLVGSAPFRAIKAYRGGVSDDVMDSDARLDDHLRTVVSTSLHMASSCRMGTSRDNSVVDQHCRVHGIDGLRVVDTSIMPTVVRRCPNATAVMIGERAAALFAG